MLERNVYLKLYEPDGNSTWEHVARPGGKQKFVHWYSLVSLAELYLRLKKEDKTHFRL